MQRINVTVREIAQKPGQYVGYFQSSFYDATYSVIFRDNLFGSVALSAFAEMIRKKYDTHDVNFIISGEKLEFKNTALLELLTSRKIA